MDARLLKKAYAIDPLDLPNPQGTVVQIVGVDTEYAVFVENGVSVERAQHILRLHGWRLPLRLNNTKVDSLVAILGPETDLWIGRKVVLTAVPITTYGQTKLGVAIVPLQGDQPVTNVPEHMLAAPRAGQGRPGLAGGVRGHAGSLPASPLQQLAQPPAPARNTTPLGEERAVQLLVQLRVRNRSWDDMLKAMKALHQDVYEAMSGTDPAGVPEWCAKAIADYLRSFEPVKAAEQAAIEADVRKARSPSPLGLDAQDLAHDIPF